MKSKTKKIVLGSWCLLIIFVAFLWWNGTGFRYIQRNTGIALPWGCRNSQVYDSGEFYILVYTELPDHRVEQFLKANGFHSNPLSLSMRPFFAKQRDFPQLPPEQSLEYLTGAHGKHPWEFAVNKSTGQLWTIAYYTDSGGN